MGIRQPDQPTFRAFPRINLRVSCQNGGREMQAMQGIYLQVTGASRGLHFAPGPVQWQPNNADGFGG